LKEDHHAVALKCCVVLLREFVNSKGGLSPLATFYYYSCQYNIYATHLKTAWIAMVRKEKKRGRSNPILPLLNYD
jgi:hypothetical protein